MTIQSKWLCLASALLTLTLFAGCTSDPIFAAIENETELKDPTMRGTITSLEVMDGSLYATNGHIYKRTDGTGDWHKISLPSGAGRCSEIASDGTNLYGRFTDSDDWTDFQSVQKYNTTTGGWTEMTGLSDIVLIGSGNGRIYAFKSTGTDEQYNCYILAKDDTTFGSSAVNATTLSTPTGTAGDFVSTDAKVYYCNGLTLTEAGSSPSGVTGITVSTLVPDTNAKSTTSNFSCLYAVNAGAVYRYDTLSNATGGWTSVSHNLSSPTTNISFLASKNLLLFASGSTTGGYSEMTVNSTTGALVSLIDEPGDSSASTVVDQDQYESTIYKYALYRIFAVDNTLVKSTSDSYVLYASVIHYSYDGLWAYYSDTAEWNRE